MSCYKSYERGLCVLLSYMSLEAFCSDIVQSRGPLSRDEILACRSRMYGTRRVSNEKNDSETLI